MQFLDSIYLRVYNLKHYSIKLKFFKQNIRRREMSIAEHRPNGTLLKLKKNYLHIIIYSYYYFFEIHNKSFKILLRKYKKVEYYGYY